MKYGPEHRSTVLIFKGFQQQVGKWLKASAENAKGNRTVTGQVTNT